MLPASWRAHRPPAAPARAPPPAPCRLLQSYVDAARRHGVRQHRVTTWVRRKLGADILVVRHRSDGSLGCAAPCVLCRRELLRFDLRVHCSLSGGAFFSGRLSDAGAPEPTLTSGQRRMLKKPFEQPPPLFTIERL